MPTINTIKPNHSPIVSQFSRFKDNGASEPPVVTEAAIMNAKITPLNFRLQLNLQKSVPKRSALADTSLLPSFAIWRAIIHARNAPTITGVLIDGGK